MPCFPNRSLMATTLVTTAFLGVIVTGAQPAAADDTRQGTEAIQTVLSLAAAGNPANAIGAHLARLMATEEEEGLPIVEGHYRRNRTADGGLAGGGIPRKRTFGSWVDMNWTSFADDTSALQSEGNTYGLMAGLDYQAARGLVVGMGIGYEDTTADTIYNTGEVEVTGTTFAPYVGYQINDMIGIDATLGYSLLGVEQFRSSGGTKITGDTDQERLFMATGVNLFYETGHINVAGRASYFWAKTSTDGYTDSSGTAVMEETSKLGQIQLSGQVGYDLPMTFGTLEPFARVGFLYDTARDDIEVSGGNTAHPNDKSDWLLAGGLALQTESGVAGSLEVSAKVGRENQEETGVRAAVHVPF